MNNLPYNFLLQHSLLATKFLILTILVFLLFSCSSNNSGTQPDPVSLEAAAALPADNTATGTTESVAPESSNTDSGFAEPNGTDATTDEMPGLASAVTTVCSAPEQQLIESLLQLVNQARSTPQSCGNRQFAAAAPLTLNTLLVDTAKAHSDDMASANFFSHQGSDGLQVWDRAEARGYFYGTIAENIAGGQDTTDEVHIGWLDSPSHCVNLMDPDVTDFGAACSTNPEAELERYWTTVFGRLR